MVGRRYACLAVEYQYLVHRKVEHLEAVTDVVVVAKLKCRNLVAGRWRRYRQYANRNGRKRNAAKFVLAPHVDRLGVGGVYIRARYWADTVIGISLGLMIGQRNTALAI